MKQTNRDFDKCPMCNGTDIKRDRTGLDFNKENQTVTIKVFCENCGDDFVEIYRYVGFRTSSE